MTDEQLDAFGREVESGAVGYCAAWLGAVLERGERGRVTLVEPGAPGQIHVWFERSLSPDIAEIGDADSGLAVALLKSVAAHHRALGRA